MNCLNKQLFRLVAAVVGLSAANAWAVVAWDETVDGPLSNNRLAPTSVSLVLGTNSMLGTTVSGDREYVTMSIPASQKLGGVILQSYVGIDETAFMAVQSGTTFTEPPTGTNVANLLGWTHFGPAAGNSIGDDLLPLMGADGNGAIGFTPPLAGGNYTFWIQQTGVNATTYQLDFLVTPEPATLSMIGIGSVLGLSLLRSRRTTRQKA